MQSAEELHLSKILNSSARSTVNFSQMNHAKVTFKKLRPNQIAKAGTTAKRQIILFIPYIFILSPPRRGLLSSRTNSFSYVLAARKFEREQKINEAIVVALVPI